MGKGYAFYYRNCGHRLCTSFLLGFWSQQANNQSKVFLRELSDFFIWELRLDVSLICDPSTRHSDQSIPSLPSYAILNLVVLISLGVQNYYARRSIRKLESNSTSVHEPIELVTRGSPSPDKTRQVEQDLESRQHLDRQDPEGLWTQNIHHNREKSYGPWTDPFRSPSRDSTSTGSVAWLVNFTTCRDCPIS